MKMKKILSGFASLAMIIILTGCSLLSANGTPPPTQDPAIIQSTLDMAKTQAAQTVVADFTKNAPQATNTEPPVQPTNTLAPSSTPLPTNTLFPTNTPLPTFTVTRSIPINTNTPVPTNTPITYNCTLSEVVPSFGDDFKPSTPFDAGWTFKIPVPKPG